MGKARGCSRGCVSGPRRMRLIRGGGKGGIGQRSFRRRSSGRSRGFYPGGTVDGPKLQQRRRGRWRKEEEERREKKDERRLRSRRR